MTLDEMLVLKACNRRFDYHENKKKDFKGENCFILHIKIYT